jgi:cysteinyl-tRNA synthetase
MNLQNATVRLLLLPSILALAGCEQPPAERDFRQDMRDFVVAIADQARATDPDFIVIPQNGQELITENGEADGPVAAAYVAAIDGQGREDLFYGYVNDNVSTPTADRDYLLGLMDRVEDEGVEALVTDYCSTAGFVDDSYAKNAARGFLSFAAHRRELDAIPPRPATPISENANNIATLAQARNFLYLINPGAFASRADFLAAIDATNYDVLLVDAFYDDTLLTAAEVTALKTKANGAQRLVIAYMSIGEAEDYRYYWQPNWAPGAPDWVEEENADFAGNFKVQYWRSEWQSLILEGPDAYINRITAAGFDGVYLDLIDAFEFFE